MILAEVTVVATAGITALAGLVGTLLGGWLTQRSAVANRQYEEITRARASLLRLASMLVTDRAEDAKALAEAAEQAASSVMTLGYGSATALTMLDTAHRWQRFEPGSFPRRRARDETLEVLDKMLERSLPRELRPTSKFSAEEWALRSGTSRPD
jgi:hypothetical protein